MTAQDLGAAFARYMDGIDALRAFPRDEQWQAITGAVLDAQQTILTQAQALRLDGTAQPYMPALVEALSGLGALARRIDLLMVTL